MKSLFYLMGKSSSGKDTIYKHIMCDMGLGLKPLVPYTTRPRREGEVEGREYRFVSREQFEVMKEAGEVAEYRVYNTVHGEWIYFTAFEKQVLESKDSYIVIGTLESYVSTIKALPEERICPIYIELDDGERLARALARERKQVNPRYKEMCRRYLADSEDFAEEKLKEAGLTRRFYNNVLNECVEEVRNYIRENM